ncbi:hypothetical protein [Parasphingorhabdus sp.]|uniref:head-tail joining protein n=1 Tax=Parasphingorhabdus sp. TaxID=2709688 RepID=UPI003A95A7AB
MPLPTLESLDALLDSTCSTVLGDLIRYTPTSTGVAVEIKAFVDHRDAQRAFDSAQVIQQEMNVQVLATLVPAKPNDADRIKLPKYGAQKFKPINVRRDESGNYWEFELKAVDA